MGAVSFDTLKPVGAAENAAARAELAELRLAIKRVRRDLTVRFGSMLVVAVAVILAAIRYLPHL